MCFGGSVSDRSTCELVVQNLGVQVIIPGQTITVFFVVQVLEPCRIDCSSQLCCLNPLPIFLQITVTGSAYTTI
jgi:hypothetical protein